MAKINLQLSAANAECHYAQKGVVKRKHLVLDQECEKASCLNL